MTRLLTLKESVNPVNQWLRTYTLKREYPTLAKFLIFSFSQFLIFLFRLFLIYNIFVIIFNL